MKHNLSRIVFILDRSGSMRSAVESTITSFNKFIKEQKELPGGATLRFVQFDDEYTVVFDKPLQDVPELTQRDFEPRGVTALLDAQGKTIVDLGKELESLPEHERPEHVIVITLTDGLENASTDYTQAKVAELIKHQTEKYGWKFIYLGANQDAVKVGGGMGIVRGQTMTFNVNDPSAFSGTLNATSNMVRGLRAARAMSFSDADRKVAMGGSRK